MSKKLVEMKNITITSNKNIIISDINLYVKPGEIIGIVGESGSGKSTILNAIDNLLNKNLKIVSGDIIYNKDIFKTNNIMDLRGTEISYIFQDPISCLNPLMIVGKQIEENIIYKLKKTRDESRKETLKLIKKVGFENADEIYKRYPHELSGGQCQKVMIASAIAAQPRLILADEPTSSLDYNNRDEILSLLYKIKETDKTSIIIVSHDIESLKDYADRLYVINNGIIIETGETKNIINNAKIKYTKNLIDASLFLSYGGEKNG